MRVTWCHLVLLLMWMAGPEQAAAGQPPPWSDDVATTEAVFRFTTPDLLAEPEEERNAYGSAVAAVGLGAFAAGWQDPEDPIALSGVEGDGAWDLGQAGMITLEVPVGPAPQLGDRHDVRLWVKVIGFSGLTSMPDLVQPEAPQGGYEEEQGVVAPDTLGAWLFHSWEGLIEDVGAGPLTVVILAPNNGSLIDQLEVHTQLLVNGEPGTDRPPVITSFVAMPGGGEFQMTFEAGPQQALGLLSATDPAGAWTLDREVQTDADGGGVVMVDRVEGEARRFWRLVSPVPANSATDGETPEGGAP